MKTYYYNLFIALMAVVGLTACSDNDDDYQWATVTGNQVYFSNQLPASYSISKSTNSITIPINRVKTDEAITVNLTHTDGSGFFNVPSSVSFAQGESEAQITVSYDVDSLVYDERHNDTLSIASADYTTIYGASTYSFSAMMPSPYKLLGKGTLTDGFFGFTTTVDIYQNTEQTNVFRIFKGYDPVDDGNQDEYLQLTILKAGDVVAGQTIAKDNLVYWGDDFNTGYHHPTYDADVLVCHPYGFSSTKDQSMWSYNYVVEYQADGVTPGEIHLAPFYYMNGVGGWNNTQNDGIITIIFPGFDKKDYTLDVEYLGRLTDTEDADFAQVSIGMGEDLEYVKYAMTDIDGDAQALYETMMADLDSYPQVTKTSAVNMPVEKTGKYQFVAIGFAGGEEVAAVAETIRFTSSHDFAPSFEPVGTGTFTYTQYWEGDDPGLTISKAQGTNTYRISHWGGDVNFDFTWDPATNKCTVGEQFIGTQYSSYGDVFVSDVPTYDPDESYDKYPCFYDPATKTFTFNLAYYVSAGFLTAGAETFVVEWDAAAAAPSARPVNKYLFTQKHLSVKKMLRNSGKVKFSVEKRVK